MISSKTQNSVCEYLLNLARNEKKLEVIRQILCENQAFEPYASFIRIDRHRRGAITPENLRHFLKDNAVSHSDSLINSTYIAQYDLDQDDKLAYSEFLRSVLPADNPNLRTIVSQRPTYEVSSNAYMHEEVEEILTKLIDSEIQGFIDLEPMKRIYAEASGFSIERLFDIIDAKNSGFIDFENLMNFFQKNGFYPYEEEIISILRRMDRDDDGRITYEEFENGLLPKNFSRVSAYEYNSELRNSELRNSEVRNSKRNFNNGGSSFSKPLVKTENLFEQEDARNIYDSPKFNTKGVERSSSSLRQKSDNRKILETPPKVNYSVGVHRRNFSSQAESNLTPPKMTYPHEPVRRAYSPLKDKLLDSSLDERSKFLVSETKKYRLEPEPQRTLSRNLFSSSEKRALVNEQESKVSALDRYERSYNMPLQQSLRASASKLKESERITSEFDSKNYYQTAEKTRKFESNSNQKTQKSVEKFSNSAKNFVREFSPAVGGSTLRERSRENKRRVFEGELYALIKRLRNIIILEKEMEKSKQDLALRPDFNLLDFFVFFDPKQRGHTSIDEIEEVLSKLNVYPKSEEIYLFMRRFDRHNSGKLRFSEFSEAFTPKTTEYADLLTQREPINADFEFSLQELFSLETRRIIAQVLRLHFENEICIENIREELSTHMKINAHELFDILDLNDSGFISFREMKINLEKYEYYCSEKEIGFLIDRFDLNRDGRISRSEFIQELTPKLNQEI